MTAAIIRPTRKPLPAAAYNSQKSLSASKWIDGRLCDAEIVNNPMLCPMDGQRLQVPVFIALNGDLMEALNGCRRVAAHDNISGDPVPSPSQHPMISVICVSLMREPYSSACNLVISFVPASCPLS